MNSVKLGKKAAKSVKYTPKLKKACLCDLLLRVSVGVIQRCGESLLSGRVAPAIRSARWALGVNTELSFSLTIISKI